VRKAACRRRRPLDAGLPVQAMPAQSRLCAAGEKPRVKFFARRRHCLRLLPVALRRLAAEPLLSQEAQACRVHNSVSNRLPKWGAAALQSIISSIGICAHSYARIRVHRPPNHAEISVVRRSSNFLEISSTTVFAVWEPASRLHVSWCADLSRVRLEALGSGGLTFDILMLERRRGHGS